MDVSNHLGIALQDTGTPYCMDYSVEKRGKLKHTATSQAIQQGNGGFGG